MASEAAGGMKGLCVFGAREGFSPLIGMFVSQLNWMRQAVMQRLNGLSQEELDWLPDAAANSIGALALHLAATEVYYGKNTFEGFSLEGYPTEVRKLWGAAMKLGDAGRAQVKGYDLAFYVGALEGARAQTLAELRKRDDAWFLAVDETWAWGPTNNACKWFHVCEHESHHAGQMDLLLKRLPHRGQ